MHLLYREKMPLMKMLQWLLADNDKMMIDGSLLGVGVGYRI
jgi:hypothetical protein